MTYWTDERIDKVRNDVTTMNMDELQEYVERLRAARHSVAYNMALPMKVRDERINAIAERLNEARVALSRMERE